MILRSPLISNFNYIIIIIDYINLIVFHGSSSAKSRLEDKSGACGGMLK